MNAKGNTVLITGGASGIGLALSQLLMASGNRVIVCGRDRAKLDAAVAALPGLTAIQADVAKDASRNSLTREVRERFPELNVLINNAGLLHVSDLAQTPHVQELEAEIAVNLLAPVELASALLPLILTRANPTIVNVTTDRVRIPAKCPHRAIQRDEDGIARLHARSQIPAGAPRRSSGRSNATTGRHCNVEPLRRIEDDT